MGQCVCSENKSRHSRHSTNESNASSTKTSRRSSKTFQNEFKLCINTQDFIQESTISPTEKYEILTQIGRGACGCVLLCRNKSNNSQVAIKKIMKREYARTSEGFSLAHEVEVLKKLTHPNIMKIFEFYNTNIAYWIVGEYCQHGNLHKIITKELNEDQISFELYQLLSAVNYLHQNGITHRDLKLENIMITDIEKDEESGNEYYWLKLIDFGTAKNFSRWKNEKTLVGTSYYIAPEVLKNNYTFKCDIWSVGVILYMMITNNPPFGGANTNEVETNIINWNYSKDLPKYNSRSNELKDLVNQLLEYDPSKRLTAEDALKHPFFTKHDPLKIIKLNFQDTDKQKQLINNLMNYNVQSKLQQAALGFICHNIQFKSYMKNALKLFYLFNIYNNGMISKEQLSSGLEKYIPIEKVDVILDDLYFYLKIDNNHKYINYEEFCGGCLYKELISEEDNLKSAFNFFENNIEKKISVNAIKSKFGKGAFNVDVKKECEKMLKDVNKNKKEAKLDYGEFKDMMMSTIGDTIFYL